MVSNFDAGVVATKLVYYLSYSVGGHAVYLERGLEAVGHLDQGPDQVVGHRHQPLVVA